MQLDIFDDSRDVMLRNDVLSTLQRYDSAGARHALRILQHEYPDDEARGALEILVNALEMRSGAAFSTYSDATAARETLWASVRPAALRLMGERAAFNWLAPLWDELARRGAGLPFHAAHADAHAAPLHLHAANWKAAESAVARIESWRRIPAPLMWMTECRYRLEGLEAAWPLLAELAWLSPTRFDALLARVAPSPLGPLRKAFDASFEGTGGPDDLAWFPAWVLIEKTGLAASLKQAEAARDTAPERAVRLVLRLLALEREGRQYELVETRRMLKDLNGCLYTLYMKTR